MSCKKSIAMVINSLEGGGAERVFTTLARRLSRDFAVTVILLDDRVVARKLPEKISVVCVDKQNLVLTFFAFLAQIKQIKPDLVFSFLTRSNQFCVASRLFFGHKVVISERSTASSRFGDASLYHWLNRMLIRVVYPFAHIIIANSTGGRDDLIGHFAIPEKKVITIYNPYPVEDIQAKANENLPDQGEYICAIGRFNAAKRFDLLIKAYATADPAPKLVILGEGPLRGEFETLIEQLGLTDRVVLPGFHGNPYPFIKHCQFFVLSSQREGFPNGLAEALILEKAVVATDCKSGPREILDPVFHSPVTDVHQGEFGVLVPVNDENALARALILMNHEDKIRTAYEQKALGRAQDFHIRFIYPVYKKALLDTLNP